jgi:C4-dicarboxylate-specific signal transduction histidine kinase
MGALRHLFDANYLPHSFCYLAQPGLIWTNVSSDTLIAVSYVLIFGSLLWMTAKLRAIPDLRAYRWIFPSFAWFIVACGATHLMDVVTVWFPAYPFSAAVKVLCAAVSVPTAILFARATPTLAFRMPDIFESLSTTQQERDQARAELMARDLIAADRERSERLIRETNERLNHILDSTSDGIMKLDLEWTILYGNRRAREISSDLKVGANFWDCYPAIAATPAEGHLRSCMDERKEVHYEVHYAPYGEWFEVRAFPSPRGMSLFYRAITTQKRLEEQLQQERALREKRVEALSHMAGGLAHEISNPLAIIHGTASDLQSIANERPAIPSSDALKAADTIVRTSDRAIRILRGLRGFARQAANDPMETASVSEIVQQAIEMQEARFRRHGIELDAKVPPDLPLILCRETQVGQIVTNLLNNAYDAIVEQNCAERWVLLEVRAGDRSVEIDVTDSGMGVDEQAREHLMDPFFTTKTRGVGMGIGLSLSRAIAHEHGGTLELCRNTANTRFRLTLAAQPQTVPDPPEASEEER